MKYSLYVNQKKAVEWGLSMGEALLYAYLVDSTGWMKRHFEYSDFVWCSNALLVTELPLVCKHKDSAKRHMASLEAKKVISRISDGNKSYFSITELGWTWHSDSISKSDESARPAQGRTNLPDKAGESAPPRSDESAPQSNTQLNQSNKSKNTGKRKSAKYVPPEWMPDDLWEDYVASRRSMKKHPMSVSALERVVASIEDCVNGGYEVQTVLGIMIETGWRSCKQEWVENYLTSRGGAIVISSLPCKETLTEKSIRMAAAYNAKKERPHGSSEVISEQ